MVAMGIGYSLVAGGIVPGGAVHDSLSFRAELILGLGRVLGYQAAQMNSMTVRPNNAALHLDRGPGVMGEHEGGVWNGGSSPHQPFHSSSVHGPRCEPNLLRPMISAPMPGPQLLAKVSSVPVLPLGSPCIERHEGGVEEPSHQPVASMAKGRLQA